MAITKYRLLGLKEVEKFECPKPKALVALMEDEQGVGIELWQFTDKNHPQVKLIDGHTAFESTDIKKDIEELSNDGFTVAITLSEDDVLRFAFLKDPYGNVIEIAQFKNNS